MGNEESTNNSANVDSVQQKQTNPNDIPQPSEKCIQILESDENEEEIEEIKKQRREKIRLKKEMKRQKFMEMRNSNTMEDSIKCMKKIAHCVNDIDPKVAQQYVTNGINDKILFIVCNTYTNPKYQLGVGPLNDAITVSLSHRRMGYRVLYLLNSTPKIFKKWLKFVLKNTEKELTIFYTGYGVNVQDKSGDESDGMDEVMLFDDGYVLDDELADYLLKYAHGQRILLLSDCCHSGSMWDIQSILKKKTIVQNILSISSAKDNQTAIQATIKARDQGIFTYYFWELLDSNPAITVKQMQEMIQPLLGAFKQHIEIATTSSQMIDEEIFPDRERKHKSRSKSKK